jgi:hypothetical protein
VANQIVAANFFVTFSFFAQYLQQQQQQQQQQQHPAFR